MTTTGHPTVHVPELAISIMTPWWWAIVHAEKDFENRSWALPKKHIGRLLWLHTGKRPDTTDAWYAIRNVSGRFPPRDRRELHLGCIVGVIRFSANLYVPYGMDSTAAPTSPWFSGPHGWVIEGAVALPNPVPCRGALGFFKPPADAQRLATEQIKELP